MSYRIRHQVIRDPAGRVKFRRFHKAGNEHYHIGIWVEASAADLDRISRVDYHLHPSFPKPVRTSENRGNKFSITIWTWGLFDLSAELHFKEGSSQRLEDYLSYELPADDGSNYADVTPAG